MKHISKLSFWLLAIFAGIIPAQAQDFDLDAVWDRANAAYVNSDYSKAIVTYDSIAEMGYAGKKLYYNLGNAWFKNGGIGPAVLNYNRALKIDPSDPDVKHNLKVAGAHVKDKIEAVPEFFLVGWIRGWRQTMSTNGWAVVSLAMFAVMFASVLLYLLSKRTGKRKLGFYCALCSLVIGLFAVAFSVGQKRELTASDEAVVMIGAAPVKSSPDADSKDIFILHEGTKVEILSTLGQWSEIGIADGNKGWIRQDAIEVI